MASDSKSAEQGDWTDTENDLVVNDYLDMLRLELTGQHYVKSQRNAELQRVIGRSRGSIEFKHMNISAALEILGFPRIAGYAPMKNLQRSLIDAIERNYHSIITSTNTLERPSSHGFSDASPLPFHEPPQLMQIAKEAGDGGIERLVRKFDPAERDLRNRALGKRGEELVFQFEKLRLLQMDRKLSDKVRWVSDEDGDGAGYDILSFEPDGRERLIEVKTTQGIETTPFYLSRNELDLSQERPDAFKIVRLYDFARVPKAFQLVPPLGSYVRLEPISYSASFT
jgi:Domain of unknown function (DUF3883)